MTKTSNGVFELGRVDRSYQKAPIFMGQGRIPHTEMIGAPSAIEAWCAKCGNHFVARRRGSADEGFLLRGLQTEIFCKCGATDTIPTGEI